VGQAFTKDIYFWGRPSAADYKADSSAGSNKGPTNEAYLAEVEARVDSFLVHHPYLDRKDVPAEMVTASGSGLDPHITPACAYVQVKRVAEARGMNEETVKALVDTFVFQQLQTHHDGGNRCFQFMRDSRDKRGFCRIQFLKLCDVFQQHHIAPLLHCHPIFSRHRDVHVLHLKITFLIVGIDFQRLLLHLSTLFYQPSCPT
jgi:hypothetical protein